MSIARPILVAFVTAAVSLISLGASGPATSGSTGRAARRQRRRRPRRPWPPPARRPCRRHVAAAASLPALPAGWPADQFELGLADAAGGGAALHARAPFAFRYQYLAGGVNTGLGWATWNTNGQFVSWYIADSAANHAIPVFPYYMLLQSTPATGTASRPRTSRTSPTTRRWPRTTPTSACSSARAAGPTPVVLHVEPDLWGYIEQATGTADDATLVPASVASSGDAALGDLPNNAAGFARAIVRLRNLLAPNVILAYHLSVWGTNLDISILERLRRAGGCARRPGGAFYASLGATFDIAFTDIGDRDADFKQIQYGDGGASWWDAADFVRYARFIAGFVAGTGKRIVVWQIPLGNTKMRALRTTRGVTTRTTGCEWFLDDPGGTHLAAWRDAGRGRPALRRRRRRHDLRLRRDRRRRHEPGRDQRQRPRLAQGRRRRRLFHRACRGLLHGRPTESRVGLRRWRWRWRWRRWRLDRQLDAERSAQPDERGSWSQRDADDARPGQPGDPGQHPDRRVRPRRASRLSEDVRRPDLRRRNDGHLPAGVQHLEDPPDRDVRGEDPGARRDERRPPLHEDEQSDLPHPRALRPDDSRSPDARPTRAVRRRAPSRSGFGTGA